MLVCRLQRRKAKGVHDTLLYSFLFLEKALGQLCPLAPLPWVTCSGECHIPGMWSCALRHQPSELWVMGLESEVVWLVSPHSPQAGIPHRKSGFAKSGENRRDLSWQESRSCSEQWGYGRRVPGVSSPGAWGGSQRPHSQPHLGPRASHDHPNPHNISNPVPTPMLGREVGRTPRAHTRLVSLRPCDLHLSWPLAWQICWFHHVEPTLHPPRAIADRLLPPSLLGHLADRLPPPSLSLCSTLSLGRPWLLPTPLAPWLPILCFLLSHSLSFFPSSVCCPL